MDVVCPGSARLVDQCPEHSLIAGQRSAVCGGRTGTGNRASDLVDDDRDAGVAARRDPVAQAGAAVVLQVHGDRPDALVAGQRIQIVGCMQHCLVAAGDHGVEPQSTAARECIDADVAAL